MKDVIFDDFQNAVDESLLRHRSLLDIITKLQETQGRINRAIAKSVTNCGCIEIDAKKQSLSPAYNTSLDSLKLNLDNHLHGELCDKCREIIEREIGNNLFYLTSLCNLLDLNLYDILLKEYDKTKTLGKYNLR
ncbi:MULTISPECIES: hypothetical protein [Clostridium]|uniref:Conserved protein n=2 Tax=Clostridium novyi TaxID=1542 RepID=A0PXS2_CLONN|nr:MULTISPECIES: hypothetical protein [Clostridium]ABK61494.1 conserved protein [Clostridium novyi NT]KEH85375.1 hypothetical protein Z966_07260 [Clostridium novyi A str. NCTC 538]KEH86655.1 hypothetical protein Z967_05445 [Clostridium novyi A str. 4540]KEH86983.1 hypothetical protein Z965_06775 [Clostridium novyi A str. BKT29909]KEH92381.1 hypothetical protein Z963_06165 [Clostridium botulinum C/D str. It1]